MLKNVSPRPGVLLKGLGAATVAALSLSGCATLPSSGPTGQQIIRESKEPGGQLPFPLVELDTMAAIPASIATTPASTLLSLPVPATDLIGPGDVLDISVYEAGVALFGGGLPAGAAQAGFDPSAKVQKFPPIRVDDIGFIRIPYAGEIRAMGHTAAELQTIIRNALRGMSQDPQILVTIQQSITNSVIVGGDVAKPGRLVLNTNHETLADVVALAGGYRGDAKDLVARVERFNRTYDVRVSDLLGNSAGDVQVYPGDRITLLNAPQTFSVMGASNRIDELRFARPAISLAEAVAQVGGSNADRGDPAAIFVFRFIKREDGTEQPTVYHLNMMRAGAYFISQRFMMHDKDVLYIGNARANQPSKLIQILSQLFAPIVTVRQTVNP